MKRLIALAVVLAVLCGALIPQFVMAVDPDEYINLEGSYVCRGRFNDTKMDGSLLGRDRIAVLTITTQADSIISEASLTIGEDDPIALVGYVGMGPRPCLSLYYIEAITPPNGENEIVGTLLIINGKIKVDNRRDTVKVIAATIQGLNNDATPYQITGSFKARPTVLE